MKFEHCTLKPASKGLRVPDPDHDGHPLPPEGSKVLLPLSKYWQRRVADGDVTGAPVKKKKPAPVAAKPTS